MPRQSSAPLFFALGDDDAAASLVSFHPDLAHVQPSIAGRILQEHIFPDPTVNPDQYNAISTFASLIASPDGQPWSATVPCKDAAGNLIQADFDLQDDKGAGFKKGQQLHTYSLKSRRP